MFEIVDILIMCFVFMLPNGTVTCYCEQPSKPPAVAQKKERPKRLTTRMLSVRTVF